MNVLKSRGVEKKSVAKVVVLTFFVSAFIYSLFLKTEGGGAKEKELGEEPRSSGKPTIVINEDPSTFSSPSTHTIYPSQILNLINWKITLPVGSSENPTEIEQPKLTTYNVDPWFQVASSAVRFRAAVNGKTTSGSEYPRSELREMSGNGKEKASWSSKDGTHIMFLDLAITAVPKIKQDVVIGQIHDDNKDVIVIRLDQPNLHVRVNGKDVYTLDSQYVLGKRFTVQFIVIDNQTEVYFNQGSLPVYTLSKKYSNAYFKAGVYTQSNCVKEGSFSLCNDKNYGESTFYQIKVSHQ